MNDNAKSYFHKSINNIMNIRIRNYEYTTTVMQKGYQILRMQQDLKEKISSQLYDYLFNNIDVKIREHVRRRQQIHELKHGYNRPKQLEKTRLLLLNAKKHNTVIGRLFALNIRIQIKLCLLSPDIRDNICPRIFTNERIVDLSSIGVNQYFYGVDCKSTMFQKTCCSEIQELRKNIHIEHFNDNSKPLPKDCDCFDDFDELVYNIKSLHINRLQDNSHKCVITKYCDKCNRTRMLTSENEVCLCQHDIDVCMCEAHEQYRRFQAMKERKRILDMFNEQTERMKKIDELQTTYHLSRPIMY